MPRLVTSLAPLIAIYSLLGVLAASLPAGGGAWRGLFGNALVLPSEAITAIGYERLWAGELEGPAGAVEAFTAAVRRDPASPYRWCELGEALAESGQIERARYCFRRGAALGPGTPSVLMRVANFHFGREETRQALAYTRQVLELTPEYDQAVFGSYARLGVRLGEALAHGIPHEKRAAQAWFRQLLAGGSTGDAAEVWRWLAGSGFGETRLADEYAAFLLRARQYEEAARVWASQPGASADGYPERNLLFNGGFERAPAGETLDWRISGLEGAEAARDDAVAASGRWSLRIHFEGRANVTYQHVMQRAVAKPGPCRFQALLRTAGITTDQGIGFQIADAEDPGRLDVKTPRLLGTHDWTRIERTFVAPPQTRLLEVRVIREPSLKFDNKIGGTAWIDDVRLAPGNAR